MKDKEDIINVWLDAINQNKLDKEDVRRSLASVVLIPSKYAIYLELQIVLCHIHKGQISLVSSLHLRHWHLIIHLRLDKFKYHPAKHTSLDAALIAVLVKSAKCTKISLAPLVEIAWTSVGISICS